ncbi:putative ribonuclease H-like domain-containing protein [Tanacetum coccineum]
MRSRRSRHINLYEVEHERLKRQENEANDAAETLRKEFAQDTEDLLLQAEAARASSTNYVNTASTPVNTASPSENVRAAGLSYPEPSNASYDDEGAVADFTNLETIMNVSHIPQSRIHYIHPTTQILGDPYSTIEPKKISQTLEDESWVDAMQEELLQFKIQKVCIMVDLPLGKKAIGTKWVYKNKKDERGVVVRNKARLVVQGHRQEEGINYDEVFTPVARIEAIRIFLDFASYMGFIVYQMDVKSTFLYGTIDEEVYVSQPLCFIDPKFPKKVYKVVKALYGLHQAPRVKQKENGIFISQDKYVAEILKKFDYMSIHDRFFSHYQRLHIFMAVKDPLVSQSKPKLGLWYPRVSAFDLEAYSDSDYAGANLDRKSTTGGCQFLNRRLISWQCKKQTIVATFYLQSKTKHIEIRHHFIRDAYEKKLIQVLKIHTDDNVADLLTKDFDVSRTMFEANAEDELWQNQEGWNLKSWDFYENCKVHTLTLEDGTEIHMLTKRRYPLIKETLERMMSLKLIAEFASDSTYELLRFIQKHINEAGSHDGGEKDL